MKNKTKTAKISAKSEYYLYFFEKYLAEIEDNILAVPKEQIDQLIRKIHTNGLTEKCEIELLNDLLARIKEKRDYYHQKQYKSYDYSALKSALLWLIILLALITLLYCFHKYYYDPEQNKMWALIEELKSYGITIKECSKPGFRGARIYWLEMSATKEYLPAYQYDTVKSMIDQVYKLHSTLHSKLQWVLIFIISGAFYTIKMICSYVRQWYNPKYKEYYEKFSLLETKIQKRRVHILSTKNH